MKIKIEIKNRWTGAVLFELEKENNTVKDTLQEAVKSNAYLGGAYLGGAYLGGANLGGAYLRDADLSGANLRGAYLGDAYLRDAYLRDAYLRDAYLRGANLRGANLGGAYLRGADLRGANLGGANLGGAYLRGAYLGDAKNVPYVPMNCPTDGSFIGWKKVEGKLIKLEIPEDARRSSASSMKCRCDKAKVLAITDCDGDNPVSEILNSEYAETLYKVGEMVFPDSFDEDRWQECSHGIHFFINKQDAINY